MKNLEALVLDLLLSVSLDVLLQELKRRLVSLDRVSQVILNDGLWFSQETANGLDAGSRLQVLSVYHLVDVLLQPHRGRTLVQTDFLEDAHKYCLESLEIPVLIDDLMNNTGLEDLVHL